jgi:hypothetical protein
VLGAGVGTFLVVHGALGVGTEPLAAGAACMVAAALLVGMQFEGWLDRTATLIASVVAAFVLLVTLSAVASDEWVTHAALNALGVSIILHVAIGRRWPFVSAQDP